MCQAANPPIVNLILCCQTGKHLSFCNYIVGPASSKAVLFSLLLFTHCDTLYYYFCYCCYRSDVSYKFKTGIYVYTRMHYTVNKNVNFHSNIFPTLMRREN